MQCDLLPSSLKKDHDLLDETNVRVWSHGEVYCNVPSHWQPRSQERPDFVPVTTDQTLF